MEMSRYSSMISIYGIKHFKIISESKILVVGAGGIGCEILKNLALAGFQNIEVVDLDTIDVSNLNRQFLFRNEHVGLSKAVVAAEAVKVFNPDIKIIPHHGNIKDSKFGVSFIAKFVLVLNALDNIDARRHVNRLCLSANVYLIDAGTTGYLGQIMPIFKKKTACYECIPKPTQKVYPICTIRSTPDKPVHCIVWAKECLKLLFGNKVESMLYEDTSTGESAYMNLLTFPDYDHRTDKDLLDYGKTLLIALFETEINKRIAMDIYKTAKAVPIPIDASLISACALSICDPSHSPMTMLYQKPSAIRGWEHAVWGIPEACLELLLAMRDIVVERFGGRNGRNSRNEAVAVAVSPEAEDDTAVVFDKDDDLTMRFVHAAATLRCLVFRIPPTSYHDSKGIAGNIIPAIATTNAIVAGLQVQQAVRLLDPALSEDDRMSRCSHAYVLRMPTRKGYYLQPTRPEPPNPACFVCSTPQLILQIDINTTTLDFLVQKVLKGRLGFNLPSVVMEDSILYEEGDGADLDLAENLPLLLCRCPAGGLRDGSLITVEDFTQDLTLNLLVRQCTFSAIVEEKDKDKEPELFLIDRLVENSQQPNEGGPKKRAREADSADEVAKHSKPDDDVCVLGTSFGGDLLLQL